MRHFLTAFCFLLATATPTFAQEKARVVATFSILGDLTQRIGGDKIELVTLVGPDQDAHGFDPNARDQRTVAGADLVIANGLGFETWLDRLTEAAEFKGKLVMASAGIEPLPWKEHDEDEHEEEGEEHDHAHESGDPHAFQDAHLVLTYIDNIAAGLAEVQPGDAALFTANAAALKAEFAALDADLKATLGALPAGQRHILTSHDAFGYFGRAYGIDFVALQGVSTDSEPSAQDLKRVVEEITSGGIRAVFLENMSDPRFVETLAEDTGVRVGGALYADALSGPDGPAPDLLSLIRYNQSELLKALQ